MKHEQDQFLQPEDIVFVAQVGQMHIALPLPLCHLTSHSDAIAQGRDRSGIFTLAAESHRRYDSGNCL